MRITERLCGAVGRIHGAVCEVFLLPVKFYRKFISPLKTVPCCRFTPTCSQYAIEAVREWGLVIGVLLSVWRIIRCNPFSEGGYDPVPKRKKRM